MRTLTRYLFREILHFFMVFFITVLIVLLIYMIYDTRELIARYQPAMADVMLYLVYGIPSQLVDTLPVIALLSTMFAYGLLAKNRELLAMIAAGQSFTRLALPALIFGLGVTGCVFWLSEMVVPEAQSRFLYLEKVKIKGRSESIFTKRENLFVKGVGHRFYYMKSYDSDRGVMLFPTILEVRPDGSGLRERIEADQGQLVEGGEGEARAWRFTNARHWIFNADGTVAHFRHHEQPWSIAMEEQLEKFLSKSKRPRQMNFGELREYRNLLSQTGGEDLHFYNTRLHHKTSYPLAGFLFALIGFAVVAEATLRHFTRGVFVGLMLTVGFFLLNAFFINLGENNRIPPMLAGWLTVVLYIGILQWLMVRLNRIRG